VIVWVTQFETGVEFTQRAMSKLVIQPASSAYQAVTSLPSRLLDNAEALVDHYLPEERKGDERPSAGNKKTHQHAQEIRLRRPDTVYIYAYS